jgi:hypothetical protein
MTAVLAPGTMRTSLMNGSGARRRASWSRFRGGTTRGPTRELPLETCACTAGTANAAISPAQTIGLARIDPSSNPCKRKNAPDQFASPA